jgi:hypothetical protein
MNRCLFAGTGADAQVRARHAGTAAPVDTELIEAARRDAISAQRPT